MVSEQQNTSLVKTCCPCGSRTAEFFSGKKHSAILVLHRTAELSSDGKHSVLVAAEKWNYFLVHERSSATVVAGQQNLAANWRCSKAESENGLFNAMSSMGRTIVRVHRILSFCNSDT